MVSSDLFSFISNMLGSLHKNSEIFGGVLVGDLARLPPINGQSVVASLAWVRFFLSNPKQQIDGHLSEKSKELDNS